MRTGVRRKMQVQTAVYLLFLYLAICSVLTACGNKKVSPALDVWFFACSEDADSILLQMGDTDIMIDTGLEEDSAGLVKKLRMLGVEELDMLILTHPDKDHIGGAEAVLENFSVRQVIQTSCEKDSKRQKALQRTLEEKQTAVLVPTKEQQFDFAGLQLTLYPPRQAFYEKSNDYSIAVLAEYEEKMFFFAGDAEKERLSELLAEQLPKVTVYKAARHGRDETGGKELIHLLQPEYAVITAKEPEMETKEALYEEQTEIRNTWKQDVHFQVKDAILDVG